MENVITRESEGKATLFQEKKRIIPVLIFGRNSSARFLIFVWFFVATMHMQILRMRMAMTDMIAQ
jgi:hypothetical protein